MNDLKTKKIQIKVQFSEVSFSTLFPWVCLFVFLRQTLSILLEPYISKPGQEIVSHTLSFSKLNISLYQHTINLKLL